MPFIDLLQSDQDRAMAWIKKGQDLTLGTQTQMSAGALVMCLTWVFKRENRTFSGNECCSVILIVIPSSCFFFFFLLRTPNPHLPVLLSLCSFHSPASLPPSRSPSPLQATEKEKESPVELTERCFRELLGRAAYGNIKNAVTPVLMWVSCVKAPDLLLMRRLNL